MYMFKKEQCDSAPSYYSSGFLQNSEKEKEHFFKEDSFVIAQQTPLILSFSAML